MINKKIFLNIFTLLFGFLTFFFAGKLFLDSVTKLTITDFHVYYYVPKMVLSSILPTHPYISYAPIYPYFFPPASVPLLYPLSLISFSDSKIIWTLLNLILLGASIVLILKSFNKLNFLSFFILYFLAVNFYPVGFTIRDGQFNIILLFCFAVGLNSFVKDKFNTLSALAISIGIISKISPGILLAYALLRKKFKFIVLSMLGVAFFMLLAEILVEQKINYSYFRNVISKVSDQSTGIGWREQSTLGLIKRIDRDFDLNLSKNTESFISYSVVLILLSILFYLEKKSFHTKFNDHINVAILTFIGVTGTGLTWFHQYSILILPLFVVGILSLMHLNRFRIYFLISYCLIYLLWAFDIDKYTGGLGYFELNLYWAGWWFLINSFILKANQRWIDENKDYLRFELNTKKINKYFYLIAVLGFLVGTNSWELNKLLQESRDKARIQNINFMGRNLSKGNLKFQIGESNSIEKTNRVDRGYVLLEKDSALKLLNTMTTLYIDPLNKDDYIFKFSSADGKSFELSTKLESEKFIKEYGNDYSFIFISSKP